MLVFLPRIKMFLIKMIKIVSIVSASLQTTYLERFMDSLICVYSFKLQWEAEEEGPFKV